MDLDVLLAAESPVLLAFMVGVPVVSLLVMGLILSRLYRRATKETAFVRTGLGGQMVVMDGGAIVLPVFHEIILVNMNTLKLEVERREQESLIARDRMRVDVVAAFFVRVKQTAEAVTTAAQTLGVKTMHPSDLKLLVEAKFVDALRATAAEMTMQDLQDKRRAFVQAVQNAVAEDLEKNGLELESVSLTKLDQTEKQYFNPDNAFDAEGLTGLTRKTEQAKVEIQETNLAAERRNLETARLSELARLEQERQVETLRAEQAAQIQQQRAKNEREAKEAEIAAARAVEQAEIAKRQAIAEAEIASQMAVEQAEIAKKQAVQASEVERQRVLQLSEQQAKRDVSVQQADQTRQTELAQQDARIAVANKSREQSLAEAQAAEALAAKVKAEQGVITERAVAEAERVKRIQLIEAAQVAEREATAVTVAAKAQSEAALVRADAEAKAAADRARAIEVEASARKAAALAEAEGKRALNEASNTLGEAQMTLNLRLATLQALPAILAESVKPMENIDSIRIVQVQGLQGGVSESGPPSTEAASLPEQVATAALRYQMARPVIDGILRDAGLAGGELGALVAAAGAEPVKDSKRR